MENPVKQPMDIIPLDTLVNLRELLEIEWQHYKRDEPDDDSLASQDMCLLSTTYLYWLMKSVGIEDWKPAEGIGGDDCDPAGAGGMQGIDGRWYSHNWLVHASGAILDLTGDQFGHEEIILTHQADGRYRANQTDAYAMARLEGCKLGKQWLTFQQEDAECLKQLALVLRSLMRRAPEAVPEPTL
jgi:hypothetical protein